jgi:hypothetical protein
MHEKVKHLGSHRSPIVKLDEPFDGKKKLTVQPLTGESAGQLPGKKIII